jgi:hypothetical protein
MLSAIYWFADISNGRNNTDEIFHLQYALTGILLIFKIIYGS